MICIGNDGGQEEKDVLGALYNFKYFLYTFRRNKILSYLEEKGLKKEQVITLLREFRRCALDMPIVIDFTENVQEIGPSPSHLTFSKDLDYFHIKSMSMRALKSTLPPHLTSIAKLLFFFILSHEVVHVIDLCTLHTLGMLNKGHRHNGHAGTINEGYDSNSYYLSMAISKVLEKLSELTPIYLKKFFDINDIPVDMAHLLVALDIFVQYHDAICEATKINEISWDAESIETEHMLQWYDGAFDYFEDYFISLALPPISIPSNCVEMAEDVSIVLGKVNLKNTVPMGINDLIKKCNSVIHNIGIYTWHWEMDPKNPWSSSLGIPLLVRVRQKITPTSVAFLIFLTRSREPTPITSFMKRVSELVSKLKLHIPYVTVTVLYDTEMQRYLLIKYKDLLDYHRGVSARTIWRNALRNVLKELPIAIRDIRIEKKVIVRAPLVFFAISSWSEEVREKIAEMISKDKPGLVVFVMPTSSRLPPSKFLKKLEAYLILLGRDESSDVILTPDYLELMEREPTYRDLYRLSLSASFPRTSCSP